MSRSTAELEQLVIAATTRADAAEQRAIQAEKTLLEAEKRAKRAEDEKHQITVRLADK